MAYEMLSVKEAAKLQNVFDDKLASYINDSTSKQYSISKFHKEVFRFLDANGLATIRTDCPHYFTRLMVAQGKYESALFVINKKRWMLSRIKYGI